MPGKPKGRPPVSSPKDKAVTIKMSDALLSELIEAADDDPEMDKSKITRKALREYLDRRKAEKGKG